MPRTLASSATWILAVLALAGTARAQFAYPPGYGDWGWGGWGGGGGASTVQGDVARGLGVLAAGTGAAREQTARANAINAETAMRWNQYVWLSQQEANRRHYARLARAKQGNTKAHEEIYRRLRDDPTSLDITKGDALNVAYDEVTNPKVYLRGLKGAGTKIPGTLVRDLPFQYASAAITTSVDQLTKGGPPPALKDEDFASERQALKETAAELRRQADEQGTLDPATLEKARGQIGALWTRAEAKFPKGTNQRRDAEKYLKALLGLTRMLETPAVDVLLAGIESRPETTLGALLTFMEAFNLRFGVAGTPRQQAAYRQLYPLLVKLRDEASAGAKAPDATASPDATRPVDFFAGMDREQLDARKARPGGSGGR